MLINFSVFAGDRPLLQSSNAAFTAARAELDAKLEAGGVGGPRLRDVHRGIKLSGISGGHVHLVQGSYDYHHYMQVSKYPGWQAHNFRMHHLNPQQTACEVHAC